MQVIKHYTVHEVKAANVSNARFQIVPEGNRRREGEESSLTLDDKTCTHPGIPRSLDAVGRTLPCSFDSREVRRGTEGGKHRVERGSPGNDDLLLHELSRTETVSFS